MFHGVKLVTIDPIAKHVGGKDPNTALEPLVAMAERTGVAVVGVHHLNKRLPKDAHPQEAFGGASGGWLGTVRFAHVLGPAGAGEPESRFLAVAKANNARRPAPAIEFYMDDVEVDLPDGHGRGDRAAGVRERPGARCLPLTIVQYKGGATRDGEPGEEGGGGGVPDAAAHEAAPVPAKRRTCSRRPPSTASRR